MRRSSELARWRERTAEGDRASSEVLNSRRPPVEAQKRRRQRTSSRVPGHVSVSVTDTLTAPVYLLRLHDIGLPTADNHKQAGRFPEGEKKGEKTLKTHQFRGKSGMNLHFALL